MLTSQFDSKNSLRLFKRNIDVYIIAPLIGFLYGRKSEPEKSLEDTTKIFTDTMLREQSILKYNYQLIMLLDKKNEPSMDKRLDKAFRNYGNNSDETLADEMIYEQYVLGGVDILYEKLIEGSVSPEDYIIKLYTFMEDFHERYNEKVTDEEILDLSALARG